MMDWRIAVWALSVCSASSACVGDAVVADNLPVAVVADIVVTDPYAPEPVTVENGSLYFTVQNRGATDDWLVAVSVDLSGDVTLHDQLQRGATMQMVRVDSVLVPAGGSVVFEPGSYHAMLRQLTKHYRDGDSLTVTLQLSDAGSVTFPVPVISYADVAERMEHDHARP